MAIRPRFSPPDRATVRRVALVSVHTSPLDQPGAGDGGGLNVYVLEVARRLAARGVEVDVFTRATATGQPAEVEVSPGLVVHHVVAGPLATVPKEQLANHLCAFALALQRHPRAGRHDLVHAHYWLSGWVTRRVAARWGVPFVQTFHTLGTLKNATLAPGDVPEPALRLSAERRIAAAADRVLGLSCGEAKLLHQAFGLSGARIAVVPAGVDLEVFRPEAPEPACDGAAGNGRLRQQIACGAHHWPGDVASDGARLLFVGRLQPLKGPDVAIATLAEVRRSVPEARLLIVGGTSGTGHGRTAPADLVALARRLGVAGAVRVVPAMPQAALAQLYRVADVVLVPSRSETFGLVALEAQACGTPVVGTRVPGLEHIVAGGTLVAGHDPNDHAAAVVRYLTDRRAAATASAAGLAVATASSWDRTVDRLLAVYEDVVGDRRRGATLVAS